MLSPVFSQNDCEPYLPTKVGSTWEVKDYNKKGKLVGRNVYEVKEQKTIGQTTHFNFTLTMYDKKDKEIYSGDLKSKCTGDVYKVDMSSFLRGDQMSGLGGAKFTVDASELDIPKFSMPAGTTLNDGSVALIPEDPAMQMLKVKVDVYDRKIEGHESKTCPAGTFETMVITQAVKTKIIVNIKASSKEWYAKNVGLVRSETYNKRGKLIGYSELSKLNL